MSTYQGVALLYCETLNSGITQFVQVLQYLLQSPCFWSVISHFVGVLIAFRPMYTHNLLKLTLFVTHFWKI